MKLQSAFLAMAMASGLAAGACVGSSSPIATGSGGASGSGTGGSSGSGGGGASCSNVTACGGSVVGTWTVSSPCLKLSGTVDISMAGLDPSSCKNVTITGSMNVSGTWTASANGTYTDDTTTTGDAQVQLPAGCLMISGTTTTCKGISGPIGGVGLTNASCTDAAGGGCTCTGTIQHMGGIGWMTSDPQTSGVYSTANNTLTADSTTKYSYCVAGNTMTWTPQPTSPTAMGTIVFQKGSTTGTGGASGNGGASGQGGSAGTGGAGGAAGAGGRGGAGGGMGGSTGTGGGTVLSQGPCDIYAAASPATPCVAAYSTVRVLNSKYTGPLYQVRKGGGAMNTGMGGTTMDIGVANGYGDSAAQDAFCGTDTCTFSVIYDQSGKGNHLKVAPAGCYNDGSANTPDYESSAAHSLTANGHKVYSLYMAAHEGYRNNSTTGMPVGNVAEGIYELADGTHSGTACCWDFGNAGTDNCNGSVMNTLFFGTGFWGTGAGSGPWFLGDFEGGVWAGGSGASNTNNPMNPSMGGVKYAFGILKTTSGQYTIRGANAATATAVTTAYDGASPKAWNNKGAVILGIGGDNSNHSFGTFFEGAITMGRPSDATDAAVLSNVQAAGYGK